MCSYIHMCAHTPHLTHTTHTHVHAHALSALLLWRTLTSTPVLGSSGSGGFVEGPWGGGVAERPVRWRSDGLRQTVDPLLEVTCSWACGPGAHAHSLSYCCRVLPSVRDADFPCRSPGACVWRPPTESDNTWFTLWSPQSTWTRKRGQLTHCIRQQSAFSQLTF